MIKTLAVGGQYTDPTDWNGESVKCEICNKQAERDDEYCEDHHRCFDCGLNDDCDCNETIYCRCGKYKEDGYELCYLCLNG